FGGTATMLDGGSSSVLDNDSDPDLDGLTASLVNGPSHASNFTLNPDGTFSYTHDGTDMIADSFVYQAYDGLNYSNATTVRVVLSNLVRNEAVEIPVDNVPTTDLAVNQTDPNWYRFDVPVPGTTINVTLNSDYDYDLYLFAPGIDDENGTVRDLAQLSTIN